MEHLKLPEPEFITDLFKGEKPIVKTMVKLAWKQLGGKKNFEFKRAATKIPLGTAPAAATKSVKGNTEKNLDFSHRITISAARMILTHGLMMPMILSQHFWRIAMRRTATRKISTRRMAMSGWQT